MSRSQKTETVSTSPQLSVIIPSYRAADTLYDTLAALVPQARRANAEVIVVISDDDGSARTVHEHFPQVRCEVSATRLSAAAARNRGAALAAAPLLVFIDADCIATPRWLEGMMAALAPRYCGVGGPIDNANPDSTVSWAGYILEFSDFFGCSIAQAVTHIPSGNLLVRSSDFQATGGFPEDFPYAQEDRLFSHRLSQQCGRAFLFHPELRVSHHHRQSLMDFLRHQYHIGRGGAAFLDYSHAPKARMVRNRVFASLLVPLMPWKKLLTATRRTLRHYPYALFRFPLTLPCMVLGQLAWASGVWNYARTRRRT